MSPAANNGSAGNGNGKSGGPSGSNGAPQISAAQLTNIIAAIRNMRAEVADSAERTAALYAPLAIQFPGLDRLILAQARDIPMSVLRKLRAIGTGRMIPELMLDGIHHAPKLPKMPLADQRVAITQQMELVLPSGGTVWKTLSELSGPEAMQLFSDAGIRTPAEQRKWLTTHYPTSPKAKGRPAGPPKPLKYDKGEDCVWVGHFAVSFVDALEIANLFGTARFLKAFVAGGKRGGKP